MEHRRGIIAGIVCFLMVLSSIGLMSFALPARAADDVPEGGTLRIGWMQEQDTLNPFITNTVQGKMMLKLIYDTLLMYNKTLTPVANLAESWTVSPDGLTWTYTLVDNAEFSDGTPLTASDVKFTFDLVMEMELSAFYDNLKFISSVTATSDTVVTVVYGSAAGTIPSDMCTVPILPEHVWTGMTKDEILATPNEDPIGSSAWILQSWAKQDSVVLDANKDYWNGAPHVDRVVFQYYANSETLVTALRNDEIDVITKELPPTSVSLLNQEADIKVATNVDLYYREISINCGEGMDGNPTLRDVHVRQALTMATDKEALINLVHLGLAEEGTTIVQKAASEWWDSSLDPWPFDIVRANDLLNDSGYIDIDDDGVRESPDGTVDMEYTLLVLSRWSEEMRTGQQLQTWWAQIGVKLNIQSADANTINSYVYPDYAQDMFLWGYSGQPDPSFSLLIMLSTQIQNWNDCGYANASYDALYDEQAVTTDYEDRKAIIDEMQRIIFEDCPYIVLYYMTAKGAYRLDTFTGFVNMPTGLLSDVNIYTLREVHLISAEGTAGGTDYTPWVIAAVGVIVALVAIAYALMRRKGPEKGEPKP